MCLQLCVSIGERILNENFNSGMLLELAAIDIVLSDIVLSEIRAVKPFYYESVAFAINSATQITILIITIAFRACVTRTHSARPMHSVRPTFVSLFTHNELFSFDK